MNKLQINTIIAGSIIEMRDAYQSFYYKVLEVPHNLSERFKILTETGIKYYLAEDFYEVSDKFDFKRVTVNLDNIHIYYEFMEEKERKKYADIINNIFQSRINDLLRPLSIERYMLRDSIVGETEMLTSKHVTALTLFGIKDMMTSLDVYMAQLKISDEYREYIDGLDTVICNSCGFSGQEEDLIWFGTGEDSFKGCKGCETDAYLGDITKNIELKEEIDGVRKYS